LFVLVQAARASGIVNAPAKAIFAACFFTTKEAAQKTDNELLDWKIVKTINDNTVVLYTGHSTPIGVTNRENLNVRGWDEENGTIYVYTQSINDPEVPTVDGRVRSVVHVSGWIIEPLEDGSKCKVTRVMQLDPKGSIPSFVVNAYIGKVRQLPMFSLGCLSCAQQLTMSFFLELGRPSHRAVANFDCSVICPELCIL
jgi:hypothetical protein